MSDPGATGAAFPKKFEDAVHGAEVVWLVTELRGNTVGRACSHGGREAGSVGGLGSSGCVLPALCDEVPCLIAALDSTLAALSTTVAMQLDLAEVLLQRQDVDAEVVQIQSSHFFPCAIVRRGRVAGHAMVLPQGTNSLC